MTSTNIISATAGGLLIGSAAGLLLILSGRIAGVSGMAAASVRIGISILRKALLR